MGVFIQWCAPHSESPYDETRIYRATSQTGTYVHVHTQVSSDITYYDVTGQSNHWYKVQFFDTVTSTPSAYSEAVQPGTLIGYCTPEDLRNFTNLDNTDLTDEDFCQIIPLAGAQVNQDIQIYRYEEEVRYIDNSRQNKIDGANKTFYTRNIHIGDLTGDMEVTVADVVVNSIAGDGTKTELAVSSVNPSTGQWILESAPSVATTSKLLVTYYHCPLSVSTPHPLIRLASVYLVASIAYSKINIGKSIELTIGTRQKFVRHMKSYREYMDKYDSIIYRINNTMGQIGEGQNIPGEFGIGSLYPPVHKGTFWRDI